MPRGRTLRRTTTSSAVASAADVSAKRPRRALSTVSFARPLTIVPAQASDSETRTTGASSSPGVLAATLPDATAEDDVRATADLIGLEADEATDDLFVRPSRLLSSLAGNPVSAGAYLNNAKAQSETSTSAVQTFAENADALGSYTRGARASSASASAGAVEVVDSDTEASDASRNTSSLDSAVLSDEAV